MMEFVRWGAVILNLGSCAFCLIQHVLWKRHAAALIEAYRDLAILALPDCEVRWQLIRERASGWNPIRATVPRPGREEQ